jgi:carbon storage regulator
MLVIRRRVGETLVISDNIEVEILDVSGSQVKVGIRAPRSVSVVRKEILVVGEQNRAAARAIPGEELEEILKQLKSATPEPISHS